MILVLGFACSDRGIEVESAEEAANRCFDEYQEAIDRKFGQPGYDAAIAAARRALELAEESDNGELEARALCRMALAELLFGKWGEKWESWRHRALLISAGLPSPSLARAEALMVDGYIKATYEDKVSEGIAALNRAVVIGRALGDERFFGQVFQKLAAALRLDGQPRLSLECLLRSAHFARQSGDAMQELKSLRSACVAIRERARPAKWVDRVRELGHELGYEKILVTLPRDKRAEIARQALNEVRSKVSGDESETSDQLQAMRMSMVLMRLHAYDEAFDVDDYERLLTIAVRSARLLQDGFTQRSLRFFHAILLVRRGEVERALAVVEPLILYWLESRNGELATEACLRLARHARFAGDIERAMEAMEFADQAVQQRDADEIGQLERATQQYVKDMTDFHRLNHDVAERELALGHSQLINRVLILALPLIVVCMFFWQRGRQHRLARAELQRRVDQQTKSLIEAKEAAELARSQAELADRAKSEFLARMNHEIRNPLTAIITSCDLLERRAAEQSPSESSVTIKACTQDLLDVIDEVLDFTRIESGSLEIREHEFSPDTLLRSAVAALRPQVRPGVDVRVEVAPQVPPCVQADEAKLRQVLVNLGQNAARHTESGEIVFVCQFTRSGKGDADGRLRFAVRDTGSGIEASSRSRVFEKFVSGNDHPGSGLGLYISRGFVTRMGGSLEFESEEGLGTTFRLTVPVAIRPERDVVESSEEQVSHDGSVRVVVVDDESRNRSVVTQLLSAMGWEASHAGSWSEVETKLESGIDLVFMDLRMPDVDGFEMLERIRKADSVPSVAVCAMSGDATSMTRERSQRAGFDGFLAKPFSPETLLETGWRALERAGTRRRRSTQIKGG